MCEKSYNTANSLPAGGARSKCNVTELCVYDAKLLLVAEQMLTSNNTDAQACSPWMPMCIMQMSLSQKTDILSRLPRT
jgi:hypothetical protein